MDYIRFYNCNLDAYEALGVKESGSLYFVSDTREIYKGEQLYASGNSIGRTFQQWLDREDEVPESGMILIYTDRSCADGENLPDIKIADGVHSVKELPFISERTINALNLDYSSVAENNSERLYPIGIADGSKELSKNTKVFIEGGTITAEKFIGDMTATSAEKVNHKLYIGEQVYDGSEDVVVPTYDGSLEME